MASLFVIIVITGFGCAASRSETHRIVREVETRIAPGLPRAQAERVLANLGVSHTYVSPEEIERVEHAVPAPAGGRIDAISPHEPDFFVMHFATFKIELDAEGRVAAIQVQQF